MIIVVGPSKKKGIMIDNVTNRVTQSVVLSDSLFPVTFLEILTKIKEMMNGWGLIY